MRCLVLIIFKVFIFSLRFSEIFSTGRWSTDFHSTDDNLQHLASRLPEFCLKSRADNTKKKYGHAFDNFCKWCNSFNNVNPLPASDFHVSLYFIYLTETSKSVSKIDEAFYAISWIHKLSGFPDPCKSFLCQSVKDGANRSIGHYVVNKKEPITPDMLQKIVQFYGNNSSNLSDLRIACMCLVSFAGFLRFSELVNLRRSDVNIFQTHMSLYIEKSKTDQHREGNSVLIARTHLSTCPVNMIERYLKSAVIDEFSNEFIFRSVTFHKRKNMYTLKGKTPLSYTRAREILLDALQSIGLDKSKFGLHSLRSGGATAAASAGVSDRLFKKHGRWSTDTAKDGYVREDISEKLSVSKNLGI